MNDSYWYFCKFYSYDTALVQTASRKYQHVLSHLLLRIGPLLVAKLTASHINWSITPIPSYPLSGLEVDRSAQIRRFTNFVSVQPPSVKFYPGITEFEGK